MAVTNAVPLPLPKENPLKPKLPSHGSNLLGKRLQVPQVTSEQLLFFGEYCKSKRRAYIQTHRQLELPNREDPNYSDTGILPLDHTDAKSNFQGIPIGKSGLSLTKMVR